MEFTGLGTYGRACGLLWHIPAEQLKMCALWSWTFHFFFLHFWSPLMCQTPRIVSIFLRRHINVNVLELMACWGILRASLSGLFDTSLPVEQPPLIICSQNQTYRSVTQSPHPHPSMRACVRARLCSSVCALIQLRAQLCPFEQQFTPMFCRIFKELHAFLRGFILCGSSSTEIYLGPSVGFLKLNFLRSPLPQSRRDSSSHFQQTLRLGEKLFHRI